ncbi:Crp/Fnr family transcriptional regulator [Yunchengibacter salinarum]|uniref:Crp/Fnr family transcriptional regulator n=1 Tax=Yunchengibacter salinarum TaxID=3133399 RepID=UPI0035B5E5FE
MVSIGIKGGNTVADCLSCPARPRMLCAGMEDRLLPRLNAVSTGVTLQRGESLFFEGDSTSHVYNVVDGTLRLSRVGADGRRQIMGFLGTGDYLGHTSRSEYSLSADALTDVKVCRFARDDLMRLCQENPALERQFHHLTAGMLDDMQDLVFSLGRKTALERVASFLVHQLDRASMSDSLPGQLTLPMTRADIADFLGLTLETVSRAFSRLKREGIIVIQQAHTIHVEDRPRLISLADGDG